MRLAGRHTLITGAGSGIGRAIAERFAAEGASVLAVGRVRVNALCPGTTQTPWIERLVADEGERIEDLEARQPLGRLGTAEEMADGAL